MPPTSGTLTTDGTFDLHAAGETTFEGLDTAPGAPNRTVDPNGTGVPAGAER